MLPDASRLASGGFRRRLLLAWAIGTAAVIGASIVACGGVLIYAIDDPYIHLAIAENILRGTYGVNLSESSSGSSSIVYPLLMAIFEGAGAGRWGPLFVNLAAMAASVGLLATFLSEWLRIPDQPRVAAVVFGIGLLFTLNAFALPMTGMEYSVHVLFCLVTFVGLVRTLEQERTHGMSSAASSCCRLSGLRVSRSRARPSSRCSWPALAICLGPFVSAISAMGLPLVPSSVTAKSAIASRAMGGGSVAAVVSTVAENFYRVLTTQRFGLVLGIGLIAILVSTVSAKAREDGHRRRLAGGAGAILLFCQLIAGPFGSFGRYEVYAVATGVVAAAYLNRDRLAWLVNEAPAPIVVGVLAGLLLAVLPYIAVTIRTAFCEPGHPSAAVSNAPVCHDVPEGPRCRERSWLGVVPQRRVRAGPLGPGVGNRSQGAHVWDVRRPVDRGTGVTVRHQGCYDLRRVVSDRDSAHVVQGGDAGNAGRVHRLGKGSVLCADGRAQHFGRPRPSRVRADDHDRLPVGDPRLPGVAAGD